MCSWLKCFAFFVTVIFALADANGVKYYLDCYWRDFNGDIPADALKANTSEYEHVYVGQGLAREDILLSSDYGQIPLGLKPNWAQSYAPMLNPVLVEHGIKILCSASPASLKWIKSSCEKFEKDIIEHKAVHGGEEYVKDRGDAYSLLIGRAKTQSGTVVGKIVVKNSMGTLYYVQDGSVYKACDFDLLVHNV